MAVYMASGCASLAGKMVAVWFPISAFVALGFDHSVANMFIIPLGMMRGAEITVSDFLMKNLIPVTLGNIVGGALCVMGLYGSAFGKFQCFYYYLSSVACLHTNVYVCVGLNQATGVNLRTSKLFAVV